MPTLLLAEDHPGTRALLAERLALDGFAVVVAEDAAGAWERFAASRPDLVVASADLPPLDGAHLFERLRAAGAGRPVPLLVYEHGHRGKAGGLPSVLHLGAHGYIPDPTRHDALKEKVEALLSAAPRRSGTTVAEPAGEAGREGRPVAQGELGPGALAEMLLRAYCDGLTGTAHLVPPGGDAHQIRFDAGEVVGVSSGDPEASLLKWLCSEGRIDEATRKEALELTARDGLSPTGALISLGALDPGPELIEVIQSHAERLIEAWFGLRSGGWRLVAEPAAQGAGPPISLAIPPLARKASAARDPASVWQRPLAEHLDAYPYRSEGFRDRFDAMALEPQEVAFALKISGESTTRDLLASVQGNLKRSLLLLWFFHRMGAVAFAATPQRSTDAGVYQPAAATGARRKKTLPEDEAETLHEEALRIVTASYFGVLGVDIAADIDDVERAYHDLATRFHPESFAEYELEGLEDLLQTVLDRAGAAYRVLSVQEKRQAYLSYLLSRYDTSRRRVAIVAEAEVALRRGIRRLEEGDALGAAQAFEEAVRLNPKEPAYLTHQAFASFRAGRTPEGRAKEARKLLKKALALDPENEMALLVTAVIEKASGDRDLARAYALGVLKRKPDSALGKAVLQYINRT